MSVKTTLTKALEISNPMPVAPAVTRTVLPAAENVVLRGLMRS